MTQKQKTYEIEPVTPVTALAIPTAATRELTPGIEHMIWEIAPRMHRAHLFGVTSPEQAYAIMIKGFDCGFSITASFDFVQVIQGKPSVNPRGALALLLSNPLVDAIEIKRLDDNGVFIGYECFMRRKNNGLSFTGRWTMEDATRAGLNKPDSGWSKYPENMCMWRAIGFAADVVFPDVTAGMTTLMKAPEMYGVALTEGGDVIDATPVPTPSVTPLNQLLTEYPADAIMAANDGKIPMNDDEVALARAKLQGG
jgi:hypothetical protein